MHTSRFGFGVLVLLIAEIAMPSVGRAQSEEVLVSRSTQIRRLYEAGKYHEALDHQRALVVDIDKAERTSTGSSSARTAEALGVLAWYALLARNFDEALAAA